MKKELTDKAKLRAIEWFQTEAYAHPLTCGNKSTHALLEANDMGDGRIHLECPDCSYTQKWVPEYVYEMYLRQLAFSTAMYGREDID